MVLDPEKYQPLPAFSATWGPHDAKVVLCGEAWGESEDALRGPFVGWSGFELSRMLAEAGLTLEPALPQEQYSSLLLMEWWKRQGMLLTNTFNFRPRDNKLEHIQGKKAECGVDYTLDPMGGGGYLLPRYLPELARLRTELEAHERHCVVAFGATASWALLGSAKITAIRGVAATSTLVPGCKVLPTYHPAGIMRNWSWRPITLADLLKVANRERHFPEVRRPERRVLIEPTIQDVRDWFSRPSSILAVDTETKNRSIEMVGFARSREDAIVIPLLDRRKSDFCYWDSTDEHEVWRIMQHALENPQIDKVFQNGLYDLQYFVRASPVRPRGCSEDTMLFWHSLMPEMPKGLGFLGSILTNEASWKLWHGKDSEELKRDE